MSVARQARSVIGIFGGTFDPVHNAHLQMAQETMQTLRLDEVRMVPCHRPPHRGEPGLSSQQRLAILEMAVAPIDGLIADGRELQRDRPSYTVETLTSLREELGNDVSLVFLMGMDAYANLDTWYQWTHLRELAHIAIMERPDSPKPESSVLIESLQASDDLAIVHQQPAGGLVVLKQSLLPVSATAIRQQLIQGKRPDNVPAVIVDYLVQAYLSVNKRSKQAEAKND